jgi:hypothetical protein
MKKSQILREVQKMIREKRESCICYALDRIICKNHTPKGYADRVETKCTQLKRWVGELLGSYVTYTSWLIAYLRINRPDVYRRLMMSNEEVFNASRAGRLAWLDWMIEQLEAKGE